MEGNQLQLALLGKPKFKRNNQPLALTSVKGQALLAYLAVTRQPHSRSALAGLLWSDMPEADARTNLRVTLSQLRKVVGDVIIATRRTVELNPDNDIWLDVEVLEQAVGSDANLTAADLYGGDFLDDFQVPEAELFEEWLLVERERLRQLALDMLGQLADTSLKQGDYTTGIKAAQRLLSIEPWYEAAHKQLMKLLAADGQRRAALAQYETCQRLLAEELGIEPEDETVALSEAIRVGTWEPHPPVSAEVKPLTSIRSPASLPPHNLPAATTSFVGREVEQTRLTELLTEADCRLVTIIGPGGTGKSRLAQTVASGFLSPDTPFHNGVYFVPLGAVSPATGGAEAPANPFISAIGATLGVPFSRQAPLKHQLIDAVREKMMLLVLDNFEHLTDYAEQVGEILTAAPGLKIIVTSRERLRLYDEAIFDLGGLPFPTATTDVAHPETFDSIRLFEQRARQVNHTFDLTAELPHVARICRLLEGMPLALELAASWVRTLPCRHVADEIERDLDFLVAQARNVPERQRSLRAAFDYSWRLLTHQEQDTFARLAIFRGGFTIDAAREVTQASLLLLASLVDKSLLQRTAKDRFNIHEALRQYGAEKLGNLDPWQARHARYFARTQQAIEQTLVNGNASSMQATANEIDNLLAAWQWAVDRPDEEVLDRLLGTLTTFAEWQGWFQTGQDCIAQAIRAIETTAIRHNRLLLGRLVEAQARFCDHLGDLTAAKTHAQESLAYFEGIEAPGRIAQAQALLGYILSGLGENEQARDYLLDSLKTLEAQHDVRGQADAYHYLSFVATGQGDLAEGLRCVEESLRRYRQLGDRRNTARGLYLLGNYQIGAGHYEQALTYYAESNTLHQALGNRVGIADCLRNEGLAALYLGRLDEAEQAAQASLRLFTEFGDRLGIGSNLFNLGQLATNRGDYHQADDYLSQSLTHFQAMGHRLRVALTHGHLGRIMAILGDRPAARSHFRQGLELARSIGATLNLLDIVSQTTPFLVDQGLTPLAIRALSHVVANPTSEGITREQAQHQLEALRKTIPPEHFAEFEASGRSRTLTDIVTMLLTEL